MKRPSLRILVAQNVPRARTGGMSRMMGFIHDEVARRGHEVAYFGADDLPTRYRGRLARFVFPSLLLRHAVSAARAGRAYDIINVHEPSAAVLIAGKKLAGNPLVVVTSHGLEKRAWELALEEKRLGRSGPTLKTRVIYPATSLWQSALALRYADHIFCLNNADRDYLLRNFGRLPEDVTRICPAAEPAYSAVGATRAYGGAERILFAGSWRKNKGIEDLVPAFEHLSALNPKLEMVVLGAGVAPEFVLQDFPSALRTRVRVALARSDADFADVYASAHAFVQPSLFEGTPQTLIEAMAAGLPVVTTATCGMRDVIDDRKNGLLVPIRSPGQIARALAELLSDASLRERLGKSARQDVLTKYTWPVVAEPVRRVYEQILAGRAPHEQGPHAMSAVGSTR